MTDCKTLIKLFTEYVGGKLVCDYGKNTISIENTNLKCNIKPEDYTNITLMMTDYSILSDINKEECKFKKIKESDNNKIITSNIKNKNHYLDNDDKGFFIKYFINN